MFIEGKTDTSFSPGMHPISPGDFLHEENHDSQNIVPRTNFDNMINSLRGTITPMMDIPHKGVGKRYFIQIFGDGDNSGVMLELYSELIFPSAPADMVSGFVTDEAKRFKGVVVGELNLDSEIPKIIGEAMKYDDFVENHISDSTARIVLDRIMDTLYAFTEPDENVIEALNSKWENRELGSATIYNIKYN